MEQKIFNILANLKNRRITIDDATDQLLYLFSITKRFNFPNFFTGVMFGIFICILLIK